MGDTKRIRNYIRDWILINANKALGREFVPDYELHIEPSSVCNLKCRFCAYTKKSTPKVSMSNDLFTEAIDQATRNGITEFNLTPVTGDVFADRNFFDKLEFLEQHEGVKGYEFFTNMTIPRDGDIDRLVTLKKLKLLTISLYGHDQDSFVAIAQSTPVNYRRLIRNLERLHGQLGQCGFELGIGVRSYRTMPKDDSSDLLRMARKFENAGIRLQINRSYDNWGGYITSADVQGLDIEIDPPDSLYKNGACSKLFSHVSITATGVVNGCTCRDVDATLRIGDLTNQPLREILSTRNDAYMTLIQEQQNGHFRPVCQNCGFYKSIYKGILRERSGRKRFRKTLVTLEQFFTRIS